MLTKTSTAVNLLDMMTELELLEVTMLVDGEWLRLDDRASLYRAAIVALMECAESEGFNIMSSALCERIRPTEIEIEEAEEPCDQLDGGCTCESCSQQIIDAVGTPTDPCGSKEFASIRSRVEHECHREGILLDINAIPDRLWDLWTTQGQCLGQMASLCLQFTNFPESF